MTSAQGSGRSDTAPLGPQRANVAISLIGSGSRLHARLDFFISNFSCYWIRVEVVKLHHFSFSPLGGGGGGGWGVSHVIG